MTRRGPRLSQQDEQRLAEQEALTTAHSPGYQQRAKAVQAYQAGDVKGALSSLLNKPVLSLPRKSAK